MKLSRFAIAALSLLALLALFITVPSLLHGQETRTTSSSSSDTDGQHQSGANDGDIVTQVLTWIKDNPVTAGIVFAVIAPIIFGSTRKTSNDDSATKVNPAETEEAPSEAKGL